MGLGLEDEDGEPTACVHATWGCATFLTFGVKSPKEGRGKPQRKPQPSLPDAGIWSDTHLLLVWEREAGKVVQLQAYSTPERSGGGPHVAYDLWAWLSGVTLYTDGGLPVARAIAQHGQIIQ